MRTRLTATFISFLLLCGTGMAAENGGAKKKTIHLIANGHIDPVWLWDWQEGAALTVSTFRVAADLCEQYDDFVFNHNEAIFYEWVEEYEPELFKRIQRLVAQGKWRIIGGWYVQADCNMSSGESLIRQIILGKQYFMEKFGVFPKSAVNFEPFGHSRGLVQLLDKCGYDAYIYQRPGGHDRGFESTVFLWEGYDGTQIPTIKIPIIQTWVKRAKRWRRSLKPGPTSTARSSFGALAIMAAARREKI